MTINGESPYSALYQTLPSYGATVCRIVKLIESAERSVWLFRGHLGDVHREEEFFLALRDRLLGKEGGLDDVRRNTLAHRSESLTKHLIEFVDLYASHHAVQLAVGPSSGPRFSSLIIDGRRAVIGLPTTQGNGVAASIEIEDPDAVQGVVNAYNNLWDASQLIFAGDPGVTPQQRDTIKSRIHERLTSLSCDGIRWLGAARFQVAASVYCLTPRQAAVLAPLCMNGAMSKDRLTAISKVIDPQNVLKTICKNYPQMAPFIHFPGGPGRGGYRVDVDA